MLLELVRKSNCLGASPVLTINFAHENPSYQTNCLWFSEDVCQYNHSEREMYRKSFELYERVPKQMKEFRNKNERVPKHTKES